MINTTEAKSHELDLTRSCVDEDADFLVIFLWS